MGTAGKRPIPTIPANDLRPLVTWPCEVLFENPDLIGLFRDFPAAA
jgi:hypothetical protein